MVVDDEVAVASETVRRRLIGFLGLRGVDANDFPIWRGDIEDLECGRGGGRGGRTHRLTLRPARVIGVAFLPDPAVEIMTNRSGLD